MRGLFASRFAATLVVRFVLFAVVWWLLAEGRVDAWTIGVPAVLLATLGSVLLIPPSNMDWFELVRFVPFFLLRSFLGGVDVARRALQPRLPIAPAIIDYPLRLPRGLPQTVMLNTISLLPGTLPVEVRGDRAKVHVLDHRVEYVAEIEAVERHVARLFRIPLGRGGE